jgi:hypothetical protein
MFLTSLAQQSLTQSNTVPLFHVIIGWVPCELRGHNVGHIAMFMLRASESGDNPSRSCRPNCLLMGLYGYLFSSTDSMGPNTDGP